MEETNLRTFEKLMSHDTLIIVQLIFVFILLTSMDCHEPIFYRQIESREFKMTRPLSGP